MILDIAMVVLFSGTTAFLIALNVWNYRDLANMTPEQRSEDEEETRREMQCW